MEGVSSIQQKRPRGLQMISIEAQQNLLTQIGEQLDRKIIVYAIGGTAMMFQGIKDTTLDIDLVFTSEKERKLFAGALKTIGYERMDSVQVYGKKKNHPEMYTRGDERFDLFLNTVIKFVFSKKVQLRAETIHQYNKLYVQIADVHDIILMKCATDRMKDLDDVKTILKLHKIDWKVLVEEAKEQIKQGREVAAFDLGCFLEDLKEKHQVNIPIKVLDALFELVQKQAKEKRKSSSKTSQIERF